MNSPFNTYEHMQALVAAGYATVKTDGIFDTFKYSRKVVYENLWNKIPGILECRGHVYDNRNGALVQAAPTKSFNYGENGWWSDVADDTPVVMYKKYNGFMVAVTKYEDQVLVSTTGSTTSDYVRMAKEKLNINDLYIQDGYSLLYEILHENDPHIIHEGEYRSVYLGQRHKKGDWFPYNSSGYALIPVTFKQAKEIAAYDQGEGFMVYKKGDTSSVCKLKTPYYVGKKMLMRMTPKKVHDLYSGITPERLPLMWYTRLHAITKNFSEEQWVAMDAQARRKFLEEMYG